MKSSGHQWASTPLGPHRYRPWCARKFLCGVCLRRLDDDWDWLAVAQHHGFPTRLLDWSYNPLAACFFAVEQEESDDAAVYALNYQHLVASELADPFDPRWEGVRVHRPKGIISRLVRQRGLFTVHQTPDLSLEEYLPRAGGFQLIKIIIPKKYRRTLRSELWFLGVDRASLMDDLDALSQQMAWEIEQTEGFHEPYLPLDSGVDPLAEQTELEPEPGIRYRIPVASVSLIAEPIPSDGLEPNNDSLHAQAGRIVYDPLQLSMF